MKSFVIALVIEILIWLFKPSKFSVKEGAGPGALEDRLRAKLRKDGW